MEIYVHIPFCKRKCAYCDFASYAGVTSAVRERYLAALAKEITLAGEAFADRRIDTVYIGGGTPSLLDVGETAALLDALDRSFPFFSPVEITTEVNPESVSADKLAAYAAAGINRISMGVQSLDDRNLVAAGRLHDASAALDALSLAGKYFDNLSCDFIIGLPFDTDASVRGELATAAELAKHVSVYELTLEEGTPLSASVARGETVLPSDDLTAEFLEIATDVLAERGLHRYEVSNFARRGYESRHNLGYWTREEYIGLGAAAHSFFGESADTAKAKGTRVASARRLSEYVEGTERAHDFHDLPRMYRETVEGEDAVREEIMLGLRTSAGVGRGLLEGRIAERTAAFFEDAGEGRVRLNRRGLAVMNSVLAEIL